MRNLKLQAFLPVTFPSVPMFTAVAGISADGRTLYLMVINKSADRDLPTALDLRGFAAQSARGWTLTGPALEATNEQDPTSCAVTERPVSLAAPLQITFPARSMTAVELRRQRVPHPHQSLPLYAQSSEGLGAAHRFRATCSAGAAGMTAAPTRSRGTHLRRAGGTLRAVHAEARRPRHPTRTGRSPAAITPTATTAGTEPQAGHDINGIVSSVASTGTGIQDRLLSSGSGASGRAGTGPQAADIAAGSLPAPLYSRRLPTPDPPLARVPR